MTNAETISKLNNALNTLIKAYEELQGDNENLKNRIIELEDEVLDLESAKEELELNKLELETNLSDMNDSTEEDNSNISSMLGKIESLLHNSTDEASKDKKTENEEVIEEPVEEEALSNDNIEEIIEDEVKEEPNALNSFDNLSIKVEEKKEDESNSNKIDLNRMASLLNGFNN